MRNKNPRHEIFFVLALAGLGLGGITQSYLAPKANRFVASGPTGESKNSYAKLECMPEGEYRAAAERLRLDLPPAEDLCADRNHGGLSKLFRMANELKFIFPPQWAPSLQADLRDPLEFLDRMSEKLSFDFTQVTSIAYNKRQEKKIYLGGSFFAQDPLEALAVLVHEARHSSTNDPGHEICRLGDIPKTSGGCDGQLTISESNAGAYSYGAAFYAALGLYTDGLSRGDRENMLSLAMSAVGTRFNRLPPALAQAHDLVAVLDENKDVFLLNPFSKTPTKLELTFLKPGETVERMAFAVRNNGLLLFTSLDRLYTWSPRQNFTQLYSGIIEPDQKILDANRIRVPFDDYSYFNFLLPGNDLRYIHFNTTAGKNVLDPFPMKGAAMRTTNNPPEISRFFMALHGATIFLDKQGVFYLGARYGNEDPFGARPDLNPEGRSWLYGNGGVMFESLFGIDDQHRLQMAQVDLVQQSSSDEAVEEEAVRWTESSIQLPGAEKYMEGLYFRSVLAGGVLHNYWFGSGKYFTVSLPTAIEDFVIFRTHTVSPEILPAAAAEGVSCRLRNTVSLPWFGQTVGLDVRGRLLDAATCVALSDRVFRSLELAPAMDPTQVSRGSSGEPARLRVLNEAGQMEILRPYETR